MGERGRGPGRAAGNTRAVRQSIPADVRTLAVRTMSAQLTCRPALAERETAFAFALPESLPALPPACSDTKITVNSRDPAAKLRQWTEGDPRRAGMSTAAADGRRARQKLADTHHCATWIFGTSHSTRDLRAATNDAV